MAATPAQPNLPGLCPLGVGVVKVWPWQPGGCLADSYTHTNGNITRADGAVQTDFAHQVRAGEAFHFTITFHVAVCTTSQLKFGPGDCERWVAGRPVERFAGVVDEGRQSKTDNLGGNWQTGFSVVPTHAGSWLLLSIIDYLEPGSHAKAQAVIIRQYLAWVVPGRCAAATCPLKVFVRVLQPIRSGLAIDDAFPSGGRVNFTVPTYGGRNGTVYAGPLEEGQKCMSGCANLLVTVIDPATGKPVGGAAVTASVDPIANPEMGDFARYYHDNEFLCLQADKAPGVPQSPCSGKGLSGLTTDKNGHVYLVYWAPGLVSTKRTTLFVSAKANLCKQRTCRQKKGAASATALTVRPNIVYESNGTLEAKEVALLVEFAQEPNHFVADLALDHYAQHLIEHALTTLDLFEEHAASIAGAAGLSVTVAVHAIEALSKVGEQRGLVATLLDALHLSTLGLAEDPYATTVPADASPYFMGQILDCLGCITSPAVPIPTTVGPSGVLWSDALALSTAQKRAGVVFATRPESVHLKVYEVSHCDEGYAVCGPGYEHLPPEPGFGNNRHGIVAQLCFYFTGSDGLPGFKWSDHFCEPEYAAPFWVAGQGLHPALP